MLKGGTINLAKTLESLLQEMNTLYIHFRDTEQNIQNKLILLLNRISKSRLTRIKILQEKVLTVQRADIQVSLHSADLIPEYSNTIFTVKTIAICKKKRDEKKITGVLSSLTIHKSNPQSLESSKPILLSALDLSMRLSCLYIDDTNTTYQKKKTDIPKISKADKTQSLPSCFL